MANLVNRIEQLSNEATVWALDLLLQHQNPGACDIGIKAGEEERRFRQVLAEPEARRELDAPGSIEPSPADWDDLAREGHPARSALADLGEQRGTLSDDAPAAIDRPAPVGRRDPVMLAIIALVVLALRPKVDVQHNSPKGWKLHYATKPIKDVGMARVLGKLLSASFPGSPGH
jgi:hypothetical protein